MFNLPHGETLFRLYTACSCL